MRLMGERRHDTGAEVRLRRESGARADVGAEGRAVLTREGRPNRPRPEGVPCAPAGAAGTASTRTASSETSARCRMTESSASIGLISTSRTVTVDR